MTALNLGCGPWLFQEPWTNADLLSNIGADIRVDINKKWPWKVDTFDQIFANHVLEHGMDIQHMLRELWRVCKPGAFVQIRLPICTWTEYWDDLTHRSHWTEQTLTWYQQGHPHHGALPFQDIEFEVLHQELREGWELRWDLKVVKPGLPPDADPPIGNPQLIAQGELLP